MTDRDPHPDSPPDAGDRPSDLEQVIERSNPDIEHQEDPADDGTTPLEPTVSPDTAGGSGGVVRNQDGSAQ